MTFTVHLNTVKMKTLSQIYGTRLTPREKDVYNLVASGFNSKQIAAILYISEFTVSNHRKSIMKKKGVRVKELVGLM